MKRGGDVVHLPLGPYRAPDLVELAEARRQQAIARAIAPPPAVDRYPVVIGKNLTLERISSIMRTCTMGYRQPYCDLLNELIERDPHAFGVCFKLVSAVANADYRVTPADVGEMASESEKALAADIAQNLGARFSAIADMASVLANLAWGIIYGVAGGELFYFQDDEGWGIERVGFIHTRRLAYPDTTSWEPYIWDQGTVQPFDAYPVRTNGVMGLRLSDFPGKFILHTPQVRGDYPTREGIGREIVFWMAVKHAAARGAPQYLERYANPVFNATYATGVPEEKRKATPEEIALTQDAINGVLRSFLHSDAITLDALSPDGTNGGRPKITFADWISICNSEMSKAGLGGTLSMEVGEAGGARALGDSQRKDTQITLQHHAGAMAATLRKYILGSLFELNYPGVPSRFLPNVVATVEDDPDPDAIIARAKEAVGMGMPVDADKLGELAGLPLVAPDDKKARVLKPVAQSAPSEAPVAPKTTDNEKPAPTEKPVGASGGEKPPTDNANGEEKPKAAATEKD